MNNKDNYYQRLSKFLAYAGIASRRKSENLILSGQISINGEIVTNPGIKVSSNDKIFFNGLQILDEFKARMWIYNKPVGELCSDFDPFGKKTVFDTLPKDFGKVCLVGRLDFNSEGLLLLTNKGYLKRYLELPKNKIIRTYLVKAWGKELTSDNLKSIRNGMTISKFKYDPMEINLISNRNKNSWYNIKLTEGKNREIRNVLGYFGLQVKKLIRTSYGDFFLKGLKSREVIEVTVPKLLLSQSINT